MPLLLDAGKHLFLRLVSLSRSHQRSLPLLAAAMIFASLLLLTATQAAIARAGGPGESFPRREAFSVEGLSSLESAVPNLKEFVENSALPHEEAVSTAKAPTVHYLEAPDKSIYGKWLDWGAFVHEFWVKDKNGVYRDLVLGFDNLTEYQTNRQFFGPIVGRYANRIMNGTFSIPTTRNTKNSTKVDGNGDPVTVYNVPNNENNGEDSLHGGPKGFDLRRWGVARKSSNSITFSLIDPDGMMGFPGVLYTYVTYTLNNDAQYEISIWAQSSKETPVLLSSHTFWNLEAYYPFDKSNPNSTSVMMNTHSMKLLGDKYVQGDGILVPTGKLPSVSGTPLDFRKASKMGARLNQTLNVCGTGCVGYDTCWIYEDGAPAAGDEVFSAWSDVSGIRLDVKTNQVAAQVYTCNGVNATAIPKKKSQSYGGSGYYGYHSCFVLEQESYIDAINQPEWGIDQILKPGDTYNWWASHQFSIQK